MIGKTLMTKKDKLKKLGAAKLADALMELASRNEKVGDYIDTLIVPEDSLAAVYRNRIHDVGCCGDFISYRRTYEKAEEMEDILSGIVDKIKDVKECFDLIVAFMKQIKKFMPLVMILLALLGTYTMKHVIISPNTLPN